MLYSNIIFTEIIGENETFNPRQGTYLIAAVNFLASFVSIASVRIFGRRPLLLFGHTGVAICHTLIGIFVIIGQGEAVLVTTCIFMFIYQNTCEPIG